MPMAVLSFLSQGYLNIILSALLLTSTACYIKQNNNTDDGTTYSTVGVLLHNNVFTSKYIFLDHESTIQRRKKQNQVCYFSQNYKGHKNSWLALRHCISGSQCAPPDMRTCSFHFIQLYALFPYLCYQTVRILSSDLQPQKMPKMVQSYQRSCVNTC